MSTTIPPRFVPQSPAAAFCDGSRVIHELRSAYHA